MRRFRVLSGLQDRSPGNLHLLQQLFTSLPLRESLFRSAQSLRRLLLHPVDVYAVTDPLAGCN